MLLKRRTAAAPARAEAARFVELAPPASTGGAAGVVEMYDARGRRLRVEVAGWLARRAAGAIALEFASVIQLTPQMRVLVAVQPVDFRKGIDGLARVAKEELARDPFSGSAFIFGNRRRTAVKILVYDGQSFWLCLNRLSRGPFRYWPPGPTRERVL